MKSLNMLTTLLYFPTIKKESLSTLNTVFYFTDYTYYAVAVLLHYY